MEKNMKMAFITLAAIIICGASFTYGALTAPKKSIPPAATNKPNLQVPPKAKPTKEQLKTMLNSEYPIIVDVLTNTYPKIATDYIIDRGQLFDDGQWYGTTLRYRGDDTLRRDTLRALLQKKDGVWKLRTTPPVPLLSTHAFPDVPKVILKTINQPVSLP